MVASRSDVVLLLAALAWPAIANGQACAARHQFRFSDGTQACISEYPFAEESAVGWTTSVQRLVPISGIYSVMSSPRDGACPAVIAMVISRKNTNTPLIAQARDDPREREAAAQKDCQSKVDLSKAAGASCACKLILEDAVSPMSRQDFDSFMGRATASQKP